jgi:hypothetical protein
VKLLCWLGRHRWHVGAVYAPPVCQRCRVVCRCHFTFQRCEVHPAAPLWPGIVGTAALIGLAFLFAWAVGK